MVRILAIYQKNDFANYLTNRTYIKHLKTDPEKYCLFLKKNC
jgi:hypothetical protein